MSVEVIDPTSAAGLASAALERALAALRQVIAQAQAASTSAAAAAASQNAVTALLQAAGVNHRWTGTSLQLVLPDGSYGPAVDLKGAVGDVGPTPTIHIGQVATGPLNIELHNNDPLNPIIDFTVPVGAAGEDGWTPVLAIVPDGERRVEAIVDWTGGDGPKPATGMFLGPEGPTADISAATDVRGTAGATGVSGANFMAASTTSLLVGLGTAAVVLTPQSAEGFATCQYMALVSQADPRNAMAGLLQSYDPTSRTLTIAVLQTTGSGTHDDWIVTPSQVLTIPSFVDDGFYDGPQQSGAAVPVSYVAVASSAASDDDGTY